MLIFAVGANVREEEISEGDGVNAFGLRAVDGLGHSLLINAVGAGPGKRDDPERKVCSFSLRLQDVAAGAMHGDAVKLGVVSGEQANDFYVLLKAEEMERPGTVFSAAPGKKDALHGSDNTPEMET